MIQGFDEWLLDVTFGIKDGIATFVPYNREKDEVLIGMMYGSDKCPGKLVGLVHSDGQEAVEKWAEENHGWKERYESP